MIDKEILQKYGIKPTSYKKQKSTVTVKTLDKSYVFKPRNVNKKSVFNYLQTRNFRYFPMLYNDRKKMMVMIFLSMHHPLRSPIMIKRWILCE